MSSAQESQQEQDAKWESFVPHLAELRGRLLKCLGFYILCVLALFPFMNALFMALATPLLSALPHGGQLQAVGVLTPVLAPLKLIAACALLASFPFIAYQGWRFVEPGLYEHERVFALPLTCFSCLLFFSGIAFCHFLVLRKIFTFIVSFAPEVVHVAPDLGEYLDFCLRLHLAFGLAFQTPALVVGLCGLDVISREKLARARPYVIVGIFVISAIITPPDVISQMLLAFPMWLLFELGLFLARHMRIRAPAEPPEGTPPA